MIGWFLGLALSTPTAILRGYVLSQLWRWFVLDIWPSGPQLGVVNAIGLMYIIGFVTFTPDVDEHDGESGARVLNATVQATGVSLLAWGFGYLWYVIR